MKRIVAAVLSIGLLGQGTWAMAAVNTQNAQAASSGVAQTQDAQLSAVLQKVKAKLSIPDTYTDFYGEPSDNGIGQTWELYWSNDSNQNLNVTAMQDGTILYYYESDDTEIWGNTGSYDPKFPKDNRAAIEETAKKFLQQVLNTGETAQFDENDNVVMPQGKESAYLYGTIYYNGVETPASFSIRVNTDTMSVLYYSRSQEMRVSAIPSAVPAVTQAQAANALKDTLPLELVYTTSGTEEKQAVLRYEPRSHDAYYVDAQTGKLVNLSDLEKQVMFTAGNSDSAASTEDAISKDDAGFIEAEQNGIAQMKEVWSREQLHNRLLSMTALGLSKYTFNHSSYAVDNDNGQVTCELTYRKTSGKETIYKYITVDAKNGQLLHLYTYDWAQNDTDTAQKPITEKESAAMQNFLQEMNPEEFAKTALYTADDTVQNGNYSYQTYIRQENGYPCPEQYLSVGIDRRDGTISQYDKNWDSDLTFAPVQNPISMEQAVDIYFKAHTIRLKYVAVPITDAKRNPNGLFTDWKLGYQAELETQNYCYGVDAATGNLSYAKSVEPETLYYSDIDAQTYPEIIKLAEYGIGFSGGTFQPQKALTQEDFLTLLLRANDMAEDVGTEIARDTLYYRAYTNGILKQTEYAPDSILTRADMVKLLIRATGYGKAAEIPNIFRCDFRDASEIKTTDYGYIAIAQGLGLIRGDENGAFHPNQNATRVQGAIVLYHYMNL